MNDEYDILIIGAGAAGLMAAIAAGNRGAKVLLIDGATKIGAKILVSGGTRCNVTNEFVHPSRFHTESDPHDDELGAKNSRGGDAAKSFVGRVLRAFSTEATHRFFDSIGVPLKLEETGKYFPVSDSSRQVLNALLQALGDAGVELKTGQRALKIARGEDFWRVETEQSTFTCRALILCCGGKALPKSGSDGAGYGLAMQFGHTLIRTTPALSPLLSQPTTHAHLSGITLPVSLQLKTPQSTLEAREGSFLFTHLGYSGPVTLNISRHVARRRWEVPDAVVTARWLPEIEALDEGRWWQDWVRDNAKKTFANALRARFPERLANTLAQNLDSMPIGRFGPNQQKQARQKLFDDPLPVSEIDSYTKAEATAGGISLREIEPATMMSKKIEGLFLAGEICDVDGWLGGYNFQWAWSSGVVAGRAAAKYAMMKAPIEAG
jgi:predicted Rossmann fold flavoprotein